MFYDPNETVIDIANEIQNSPACNFQLAYGWANRLLEANNRTKRRIEELEKKIAKMRETATEIEKLAHCDLCNVKRKYQELFDQKFYGIERLSKSMMKE